MTAQERIRTYIFGTLLALPKGSWPDDRADVFAAGLDSLRVTRLLVYAEKEFGVTLPDDEITAENLASVASIAAWIESHLPRV